MAEPPSSLLMMQNVSEEIKTLRLALVEAVAVIRTWHGLRLKPADEAQAWKLYFDNAPEMKRIREALRL